MYTEPVPGLKLSDDFGDAETLFNSREWLEKALVGNGAKITGKGCGLGQSDLDVEIEGFKFNVSIRPS